MWRLCASGHQGASNIGSQLPILVASSHCARRLLTELENPDNLTISPKLCDRKGNHALVTLNLKSVAKGEGVDGGTITNRLKHKNVDDLNRYY